MLESDFRYYHRSATDASHHFRREGKRQKINVRRYFHTDRSLMRVIFTQDEDFLREAHRRQEDGRDFVGVIYAHQLNMTIGQCVNDLELIAKVYEPEDWERRVEYLPLK
jgi:hypothetical protein